MSKLRHPNIIKPENYYEDSEFMLLIMPYMQYDLKTYMRNGDVPKYIRRKQIK